MHQIYLIFWITYSDYVAHPNGKDSPYSGVEALKRCVKLNPELKHRFLKLSSFWTNDNY